MSESLLFMSAHIRWRTGSRHSAALKRVRRTGRVLFRTREAVAYHKSNQENNPES
jgi:hypothetical protein